MANLSQEQVKRIVENAPAGSDPRKIVQGLVERGHTLEGLDADSVQRFNKVEQQTEGNQFEQQKKKGFVEGARDFAVGLIGGGKLAEGAGMAIAAPEVQKNQSEALERQIDTQGKLIKLIRDKKDAGLDASRLEKALDDLDAGMIVGADASADFVEALPSDKEVIGSAARLAGTIAAPNIAGAAGKLTGVGQATSIVGGATRGLGAGALAGGVEGAIQGTGLAAEADRPAGELLSAGVLGAVGGAVTGGVLGAAGGAIAGGLKGRAIKAEEFADSFVAPKETSKVRAEAIRQGRLKDPGLFKKAEIQASNRDKFIADSVRDVVSPKATVGENIDAIRYKIDQTDDGVRSYITQNKVPFNSNQLKTKLVDGKGDLGLIFASDSSAEKTYDAVTEAFMRNVGKKDTLGLFDGRQNFDQLPAIKKLLDNDKLGENARKEIVLSVRRAANDYIASLLPEGNQYKALMSQQSYALEALGNIAEKSVNIIGKNNIQLLADRYPLLKWIVGGLVGGTVAGGVGTGAAFVNSSE